MSGGAPAGFSEFATKAQQPTMSAPAGFSEFATKAQQPTNLTIEQLDAQEQRNRPGLLTGVLQAGKGAINEVGNIAKVGGAIGGFAAKSLFSYGSSDSPANVMTNRVIKGLYKKAHEEFKKSSPQIIYDTLGGLYDVLGNVASETGKSIGIDNSRPGPNTAEVKLGQNTYGFKMDRDVAIQKWTTKPLSAAFDLAIIKDVYLGIANGAIKGVAKENAEKAVFDALKNNGDNMSDMVNAIKTSEGAAATSMPGNAAAIPDSMPPQAPILSPGELFKEGSADATAKASSSIGQTRFEKLFKYNKIITDPKSGLTRKALNDVGWVESRSRDITESLINVSKKENENLYNIIDPIKNIKADINEVKSKLFEAKKEALTPEVGSKLDTYLKKYSSSKYAKPDIYSPNSNSGLSLGEIREDIKRIDNSVYPSSGTKMFYTEDDKALLQVRGILRDALAKASPAYDEAAKRVSSRIKTLGGIEGSLLKAEGTVPGQAVASDVGLKIFQNSESENIFRNLIEELANDPVTAKYAGELSVLTDNVGAWKTWNDFFNNGESVISGVFRSASRNSKIPFIPDSMIRSGYEIATMARLNPMVRGAVGNAAKLSAQTIKGSVKKAPFAARVLDQNNK